MLNSHINKKVMPALGDRVIDATRMYYPTGIITKLSPKNNTVTYKDDVTKEEHTVVIVPYALYIRR